MEEEEQEEDISRCNNYSINNSYPNILLQKKYHHYNWMIRWGLLIVARENASSHHSHSWKHVHVISEKWKWYHAPLACIKWGASGICSKSNVTKCRKIELLWPLQIRKRCYGRIKTNVCQHRWSLPSLSLHDEKLEITQLSNDAMPTQWESSDVLRSWRKVRETR